jgi:hypothetical protein
MAVATAFVAAGLLLLRLPEAPAVTQPEITLHLQAEEAPPAPAEEFTPLEEIPLPAARTVEPIMIVPEKTPPIETVARDWYADLASIARDVVDASGPARAMQPAQQEARRRAAVHFAPPRVPVRKPAWENVEIDQMGRKVLVSGDCYRVLEDWRVTYQDIQREFGQYLVHCSSNKDYPIDVDWVDDIGQKFAYIQYANGDIPPDELNQFSRKN